MDKFTNIGKAAIIQSLGIQKNYTEVIESTVSSIDYNNTACSSCKCKAIVSTFPKDSGAYNEACAACEKCTHRKMKRENVYKKIYHNEKNRYGYRPMLKGFSIKLFWLLHFYHPDNNGIVHEIDAGELAAVLGCNIRTVWNNLKVLEEYTYISYSKNEYGFINVILNDYEKYYLPAAQGGRGFLVVSKELMQKLIKVKSLVTLRICIRELLELDSPELKGQAGVNYKHIRDIRNTLPAYCKPSVIKSKLAGCPDIFTTSISKNVVKFEINPLFIPKTQKKLAYEKYTEDFKNFLWDFNRNVAHVNAGGSCLVKVKQFFDLSYNVSYKPVCLKPVELSDLANLALHYSYNLVIDALSAVYKKYIMGQGTIHNLGGLVSRVIRNRLQNIQAVA